MKIPNQIALEFIVAYMPAHVYWKDVNGVYLGCNDRQANSLGFKKGTDVIGKTDFELPWPEGSAERFRENDTKVMELGQPLTTEENGKRGNVEIALLSEKIPLKNNSDQVIGVLGISIDISALKEAQKRAEVASQSCPYGNCA